MKNPNEKWQIGILGAGSFGSALAHILRKKNHNITLWGRNEKVITDINRDRKNSDYLPSITLENFLATTDLEKACRKKDLIILAIPSQFLRNVLNQILPFVKKNTLFLNTAKGIERNTLMTPSQIFTDVFGTNRKNKFSVLSGPTFALELAQGQPSGAALACYSKKNAQLIQEVISLPFFRPYSGTDVMGAEIGGALKNIYAIGTGITDGLGLGTNTRAGLITRCLNEMTKLGVAMGAKAITFSGLSGLGDLILTCTGDLSRNRSVGLELGRGKTLPEIMKNKKSVAEGIETAVSVHELMKKYNVEMPNANYVYRILHEGLTPKQAMKEILSRRLKEETKGLE